MDDFALIEESTFISLVNHYCFWETISQLNPDIKSKVEFDQIKYEEMRSKFLNDYINVPIDLSAKAADKLNDIFNKEDGEEYAEC